MNPRPGSTLLMQAPPTDNRDWRATGVCVGEDPDLWFSEDPTDMVDAARTCRRCPVATTCLQWAIDTKQETGTWGSRRFPLCARTGCTATADTARRMCARHDTHARRASDTCANGHPYKLRPDGTRRYCPTCQARSDRERRRVA